MQPKHTYPNRATVRLAVLRLLLLPDNESELTKDDYEFLKGDLARKILQYWPAGFGSAMKRTKLKSIQKWQADLNIQKTS
jgi:hypothetical protein